jgi:hypothetical protein
MSTWAPANPIPESDSPDTAPDAAPRWSVFTRVAFRFAFCYLGGYCIFNGNATVLDALPVIGRPIQDLFAQAFLQPAQFLAGHLFHVPPPGNHLHPTGSGDTAIDWIAVLILLCASILATAIWSTLDRRRPNYRTLSAWLRFLIRLTVAMGMVIYGMNKVFPMQMEPPTVSDLSLPMGMHSPMSLLWLFIGFNPLYEMICGAAELLGGLLLLFRRTALAGALFSAFVVSNVLLYNLFFDVPVKLYAGHLLLLSLFLILPDARALFRFFWLHQPAAPTGAWVPPTNRRWFRRTTVGVEIAFAALALGQMMIYMGTAWHRRHIRLTAPCPLCGAWHIDTANLLGANGVATPHSLPTSDGRTAVELDINDRTLAVLRDTADELTYIPLDDAAPDGTLKLLPHGKPKIVYAVTRTDATHITLTPTGDQAHIASILTLTLISPPGGYPLMNRGFHWVSEYPYTR